MWRGEAVSLQVAMSTTMHAGVDLEFCDIMGALFVHYHSSFHLLNALARFLGQIIITQLYWRQESF
jgi:hypothetical protein